MTDILQEDSTPRPQAHPAPPRPATARLRFWPALKAGFLPIPVFAIAFAALVPVHALWLEQPVSARIVVASLIFFAGGLAGGGFAWIVTALLARGRAWSARFSLALIANAVSVPPATAFLFFLQYRTYYAQWHEEPFTTVWFWQIAFTGATALYLFAVSAVKYIFPLGLPLLFGVAAIAARRIGNQDLGRRQT
ncbi:MAG: hypothetical protein AAGL24_22630 [Pseudomonadota bacterium]